MSKRTKILILAGIVILLAFMIVFTLKKGSGKEIDVTVVEVERGDITRIVSGSGRVQPEVDVDISARISAEITKINVEEGENVKKGKILVELDRQRYDAALEQAESMRMSAKAELKKAQADYTRVNDLFEKDLISQADLDAAEAALLSAKSHVRQMEAQYKQAKDDLQKTRLIAPITGTVVRLYKEEGEIAVGSQFQADPIINVSDLNRMEVLAEIDENDIVFVSNGDKANIEVDAIPDTLFEGVVSEIAHMATTRGYGTQEQVTNFEVKIAVTTKVEQLRPGMSATVDIETETHKDVLKIPIQCVAAREVKKDTTKTTKSEESEMEEVVFVVNDNIAHKTPVETGISDDTHIEISDGLQLGETVISGSYKALSKTLKDKSPVNIKKEMGYKNEK